ncbi:hypothetical protein [Cellulomonas sp. ATA003]|uniref:hypothetical protein n=1 Tax=Cellulomonas sp. ATA003 TaxID=3073064 RepID=UPI0028736841|nr:hypothetical protein [Cellulomonas sp. ATA003]WNB85439.1 hypothetical protein REH70_17945 [Cellulomonas sp. ATA003]
MGLAADPSWRDGFLWPKGDGAGTAAWPSVQVGTPPTGDFVPAGTAGVGYTSPGYADDIVLPVLPAVPDDDTGDGGRPVGLEPMPVPTPAPVPAPISPVGNVDGVVPVAGGVRVRGWAADRDTTAPLSVDITIDGATRRVTTGVPRADVPRVFPDLGAQTGFDTVIPVAPGRRTVCVTFVNVGSGADRSFDCRTVTVDDVTAPTFAGDPALELREGVISSTGLVPVTARWSVADDVAVREVRLTSPIQAAYSSATLAVNIEVPVGTSTWSAAADDHSGNTGAASSARTVTLVPDSQATRVNYWWGTHSPVHTDGTARRTNRAGASMAYTFAGRSVAWVASKEANHGRAHVYVDGVRQATIDLQSSTKRHREIVFTHAWEEPGVHTITVVVEGTSGRPTVTSDGFITVD